MRRYWPTDQLYQNQVHFGHWCLNCILSSLSNQIPVSRIISIHWFFRKQTSFYSFEEKRKQRVTREEIIQTGHDLVHCLWQKWLTPYWIINIWTDSNLPLDIDNTRTKWAITVPRAPPWLICGSLSIRIIWKLSTYSKVSDKWDSGIHLPSGSTSITRGQYRGPQTHTDFNWKLRMKSLLVLFNL